MRDRMQWPLSVITTAWAGLALFGISTNAIAQTQTSKPNILVIFGDDIGPTNISAYTPGVVGYKTPNIDRIARKA